MSTTTTVQPVPAATVNAGGLWQSVNGGLSDALNLWAQVEQIKGIKSAQGADLTQAVTNPELANGAAIQVDQTPMDNKVETGFVVEKPVLYASLALLGLAFVLRMKGFK